jgi:hypothetical protein
MDESKHTTLPDEYTITNSAFNSNIIPQDEIFWMDAAFSSYRDSFNGDKSL